MTQEPEKDRILRLYNLLWEKIKDEYVYVFEIHLEELYQYGKINHHDYSILENHIKDNFKGYNDSQNRKLFVQKIINKLENINNYENDI